MTRSARSSGPASAARTRRPKVVHQRSAGGVVAHEGRFLLIATAGGTRWQLPKGHIEPGESSEQAAVREVREETGVSGRVVAPLEGIDYWFAEGRERRIRKHVDYYLLAYQEGTASDYDQSEVDDARWFPAAEAVAMLTHDNERRVAEQALVMIEKEEAG